MSASAPRSPMYEYFRKSYVGERAEAEPERPDRFPPKSSFADVVAPLAQSKARPRPKRTVKIVKTERVVSIVETVTTIEIDEDEDSCPIGSRLTSPPFSPPAGVAIDLTTGTQGTVERSSSTTVIRGDASAAPSYDRTRSALAALVGAS